MSANLRGYIILGVCLFLTGCKDSPRNHEEIKKDALECVNDFIEDIYKGKDVSESCTYYLYDYIQEIEDEFNFSQQIYNIIKRKNIKLDPQKVSYSNKVEEIREKGRLEYTIVKVRYNGKEIVFHVRFNNSDGTTGTEGKPVIWRTFGLVGFDNSSFSKKSGFTLEYDKSMPDIFPYLFYTHAVAVQRLIAKQKGVSPDKVVIPQNILRESDEKAKWNVYCGDTILYQCVFSPTTSNRGGVNATYHLYYSDDYTPKIKRIIKLK